MAMAVLMMILAMKMQIRMMIFTALASAASYMKASTRHPSPGVAMVYSNLPNDTDTPEQDKAPDKLEMAWA